MRRRNRRPPCRAGHQILRLLKDKAVNPTRGDRHRLADPSDRRKRRSLWYLLGATMSRRPAGNSRDRSALIPLRFQAEFKSNAAYRARYVDKSGGPEDVVFVYAPPLLVCPIREHDEIVRGASQVGSMAQANPKRVWHLSRRDEPPCVVSDRELLLLAKLGHLRADDMLWGPDFDGYRPVRSLLGDVPASKQIRVEATAFFGGAVETTDLYTMPTTTLGSAKRRLNLLGVVGLLVGVALLAGLGLVTYRFLATDPEPATHAAAVIEPVPARHGSQSAASDSTAAPVQQPAPQPATANAESPVGSATPAEPPQDEAKADVIVRTVKVVDIDPPQVANASSSVPTQPAMARETQFHRRSRSPLAPEQSQNPAGHEQASSGASGRIS